MCVLHGNMEQIPPELPSSTAGAVPEVRQLWPWNFLTPNKTGSVALVRIQGQSSFVKHQNEIPGG